MKKNKWILIIGLITLVLLLNMQQKKEYKKQAGETMQIGYTENAPVVGPIYSGLIRGQTFTTTNAFTLSYIKLRLRKYGSPLGPLLISIRNVDASGFPTGADLVSTSLPISSLSTGTFYYTLTFPSYQLESNTKYAIVLQMNDGNMDNEAIIFYNLTGNYMDGDYLESLTSIRSGADAYFEMWGTVQQDLYASFLLERYAYINGGSSLNTFITNANPWISG